MLILSGVLNYKSAKKVGDHEIMLIQVEDRDKGLPRHYNLEIWHRETISEMNKKGYKEGQEISLKVGVKAVLNNGNPELKLYVNGVC